MLSLIEDGSLELQTTARSVLGEDLALIDDAVTVEQLLSHRSGIGDYLDEDAGHEITDYVMPVPVHELATRERYLRVLGGHPTAFSPDERRAVPRARASACVRACRHGRHRVPPLG
jgi:CubicO group peptidase (beta-lactamase class C family)